MAVDQHSVLPMGFKNWCGLTRNHCLVVHSTEISNIDQKKLSKLEASLQYYWLGSLRWKVVVKKDCSKWNEHSPNFGNLMLRWRMLFFKVFAFRLKTRSEVTSLNQRLSFFRNWRNPSEKKAIFTVAFSILLEACSNGWFKAVFVCKKHSLAFSQKCSVNDVPRFYKLGKRLSESR